MGKKNLLNKYKKKKSTEKNSNDENCNSSNDFNVINDINESYVIMQKLNSNNYSDRDNITALLASHEFSPSDLKMKEQLVSADFCKVLVSKLSDPFIQVRYNAISAIINLIICYSESDMDAIFLFNAELLPALETLLVEYRTNMDVIIKYSQGEQTKINKLIKNIVDLLLLLMDLYDTGDYKDYNKLNMNNLISISINFILNPGFLDEDVILNFVMLTASFFTLKVVKINNDSNLLTFIQFAENIVFNSDSQNANVLVVACFTSCLFYFYCSNINIDVNPDVAQLKKVDKLIEMIYHNINFNLASQIEELNLNIQNIVKDTTNSENAEMMTENDEGKHHDENSNIKKKIKRTENYIRATLNYLKTFTDIINSVELNFNSNKNLNSSQSINDEDLIEDIEEEEDSGEAMEGKSEIEKNVSGVVNFIFRNSNFEQLKIMLHKSFLENLTQFFSNLSIEEFLLSDFDKMIKVKELLYDLEYYTLSLINNIIQNIDNIYVNESYSLGVITNMIIKRLQIEEYSKNQDFLSVMLTCFRSILEKYKSINQIIDFTNFDFKFLFVILNNNVDDRFIKINIIDIISFLFSYKGHSAEANLEICKLLFSMCLNENDMEVTSHVLNAYYDIYGEDDYNFNLKSVGVIEAMKCGVNEFRSRFKNAYTLKEIDKDAYDYAKETLVNLKRFVRYKENMFRQQNLN